MKLDKNTLNEEFSKISTKFNPIFFKTLTLKEKKELFITLSEITANAFDVKLDKNKILFVSAKEIGIGNASFNFHDNTIRINENLMKDKFNIYNFTSLIDSVVHETVHYCQKQRKFLIENLSTPLPQPYRMFQAHEVNAYDFAEEILNEFSKYFDDGFASILNSVQYARQYLVDKNRLKISERGYGDTDKDIEMQMSQMLPFYKNVNTVDKLNEEHKLDIKIKMFNQHIDAISMNGNGICGILSANDIDGKNKLHFTIKDDVCFINEIIKVENKNGKFAPVSNQNKEILISNLNKIIDVGNNIEFFNCKEYLINPISIVDNKEVHDKFVDDVQNGKIKISGLFKKSISEEKIKKDIFNDIENR